MDAEMFTRNMVNNILRDIPDEKDLSPRDDMKKHTVRDMRSIEQLSCVKFGIREYGFLTYGIQLDDSQVERIEMALYIKRGKSNGSSNERSVNMSEETPKFDNVFTAARWLRANSKFSLTNESFREILSSLMGRPLRDEESVMARIVTLPTRMNDGGFVTKEEKAELDLFAKDHQDFAQTANYKFVEEGIYLRIGR